MQWSDIDFRPREDKLEQFGMLGFAVLFGWAWWYGESRGWPPAAGLACAAAGALGLVAVGHPRWLGPLFVAASLATFPVGWLVSRMVLGALLYGMFTPLGLAFRLAGRDPLALRRRATDTYWTSKPAPRDRRRYLRQY